MTTALAFALAAEVLLLGCAAAAGILHWTRRRRRLEEQFATARDWFDKLRESFPEYFETQKLGPVYELVKTRAEQAEAAKKSGVAASGEDSTRYTTGFEPHDPPSSAVKISFDSMMGIEDDMRTSKG